MARPLARALLAVLLSVAMPALARAQAGRDGVSLLINYRADAKSSLLVLPVAGASGDSIATIFSRDFVNSDRFNVVPTSSAIATTGPVNYPVFSKLAIEGIVQATLLPSGWLRVALHDVALSKIINQKDFPLAGRSGDASWRFGVHTIADAVEEWITGQRGISATRIAFERDGRIWTVDSDGANARAVTSRGMAAQWTPSGRALVYNVIDGGRNPVLVTEIATGAQRTLTTASNVQDISPAVSPDGRIVIFARSSEDGTDLYAVPFEGGPTHRITVGRGKGSYQPTFSPDGQRIAFASDRLGHSEVYTSDVDGTNAELLTSASYGEKGDRSGPTWSPDGRLVAYHSDNGGQFQIMTVNLRDQSVKQITSEGRNEDPSFAPDGRHLAFTSQRSGTRQIWVVDVVSGRARQLTRGSGARLAAWSPRLATP